MECDGVPWMFPSGVSIYFVHCFGFSITFISQTCQMGCLQH